MKTVDCKFVVGDRWKDREGNVWEVILINLNLEYPIVCKGIADGIPREGENSFIGTIEEYPLEGKFYVSDIYDLDKEEVIETHEWDLVEKLRKNQSS